VACGLSGAAETAQKAAQKRPAAVEPSFYPLPQAGGIKAITAPKFVSAAEAGKMLLPDEPVVGVSLGGNVRAYSLWLLDRHLVVNDSIGGRPVAVTWCPFSHTAVVYGRSVGEKELTLEPDGRLRNDAIVLRDRETGSVWTQQDGRAIEGPQVGGQLQTLPALLTTWKTWQAEQPNTTALDKGGEQIHASLYAAYAADSSQIGLGHVLLSEPRMAGKALVVGIISGEDRLAVPLSKLKENLVQMAMVDRQAMALLYDPATDTVRVVRAEARGHKVSLRRGPFTDLFGRRTDPYLLDEETVSRWDLTGKAISGAMEGHQLPLVPFRVEYWYAWQAYFPKSRVE
jgi:hypothetical protein